MPYSNISELPVGVKEIPRLGEVRRGEEIANALSNTR